MKFQPKLNVHCTVYTITASINDVDSIAFVSTTRSDNRHFKQLKCQCNDKLLVLGNKTLNIDTT